MRVEPRVRALPKAHLHLHLDGAIRPDTLRELCQAKGIAAPHIPDGEAYPTFAAFMETITATHAVLADPGALARVVDEIVVDSVDDGAVWVEVSVWPGLFGPGSAGEAALEVILFSGLAAARRLGAGFGVMVAANRHEPPAAAVEIARLAARHVDRGVVSFGLDGDEAAFAPDLFGEAFAIGKQAGLLSTPHAGELRGPESVIAAVDILGADRILHGVRAVEDPRLVERLAGSDLCLDVCPTSNVKLSVVPNLASHPLPAFLAAGVACTLNADDPLLFQASLAGEYQVACDIFGLSEPQLAAIARTSIDRSGAPEDFRRVTRRRIEEWETNVDRSGPGTTAAI